MEKREIPGLILGLPLFAKMKEEVRFRGQCGAFWVKSFANIEHCSIHRSIATLTIASSFGMNESNDTNDY